MHVLVPVWRSTVGRKALAAVSGLALFGWVALHVAGNLTLFRGAAATDGYAAALHAMPAALWAVRVALALALGVHVAAVASLARAARAARPRAGRAASPLSAIASRTMRVGGALLLAFVAGHVLHLTLGVAHPAFHPGHVYANVVRGLGPVWVGVVYVGAAALLGLHLFHGLRAMAVSLGLRLDATARERRPVAAALSAAVAVGFAAVPLAVLTGWLR